MNDTPLGQYISIRSEKDKEVIKKFSSNERKIYDQWRKRIVSNKINSLTVEEKQREVLAFQKVMKETFSKKGGR